MVKSATVEWSEITLRSQARPQSDVKNFFVFFDFFACVTRALDFYSHQVWLLFGLNKQQQTTTKRTNMAKALSKAQIAALVAEKNGLSKKQAVEILDSIAALAYKHAKDTFTLPGIGKLVLKNRAARMGRNPKTGEAIQIKAKRVVKFRVAKAAKDAILGGK
jgi:DNA-binding protein HU-beta